MLAVRNVKCSLAKLYLSLSIVVGEVSIAGLYCSAQSSRQVVHEPVVSLLVKSIIVFAEEISL